MIDDPKPLPPEILADALQDKIHEDKGEVRAAKSHKSVGLKPCPFCGNAPRVAETTSHYIVCSACSTYGPTGDDNLDAAHKWNTRPESEEITRLRARIKELESQNVELRDDIGDLTLKLIEAEEIAQTWQPIKTAPSDTCVLLYCPDLGQANSERVEARIFCDTRGGSQHAWATHWMPLPEPPAEP